MKILILYDSLYGNTQQIAPAISQAFPPDMAKVVNVKDASLNDLTALDILIVGSPTQGGQPKPELQAFLERIPSAGLTNVQVAAFDTRFLEQGQNMALRLLMKTIGYAAPKLAQYVTAKGGHLMVEPIGFIVVAKKGPLAEGELTRATAWGNALKSKLG